MAIEITVPRLGWSMDEGTFGEWLKRDGEFIEAGEPVFTLESEKALQEVESVDSGTLHILPDGPQDGDTVTVGTRLGWLLADGEAVPQQAPAGDLVETVSPVAVAAEPVEADVRLLSERKRAASSPRARRLAGELGIDWQSLTGSGRTGRIRERDVRAAAGPTGSTRSAGSTPSANSIQSASETNGSRPPGVRRVIAERMLASAQSTAAVTLTSRADASNLLSLRRQFQQRAAGIVPAIHDIVAKLIATTLLERPHSQMSIQWHDGRLVEPSGVHIGIAVETDAGLLVPVLRDCERRTLTELATGSRDLIQRARDGKCSATELRGGTFSITNLGMFGIDAFTPMINVPETAILGLGAIRREAAVGDDDRIVARDALTLSLTFDHRVVDGAPAARFLQALVKAIENPAPFLIS